MTQPPNHPTEPEDSLSRLMHGPSGILAAAALLLGLLSLLMFQSRTQIRTPPSLLAVNISFCVILMGITALYRVRRMSRQTLTRLTAAAALLLGLAGPVIYSWQTLQFRQAMQNAETANVSAIVSFCHHYAEYAEGNHGSYPPDLATLVSNGGGGVLIESLVSPYTGQTPDVFGSLPTPATTAPQSSADIPSALPKVTFTEFAAKVRVHSDYEYVGADLRTDLFAKVPELKKNAIVVFSKEARMRAFIAVGFADGRVELLGPEQTIAALKANNESRAQAGLPPLSPPQSVTAATAPTP
ncbi:MAG: hypothetical protein WCI73_02865 [Phycisphaerae bacterium]